MIRKLLKRSAISILIVLALIIGWLVAAEPTRPYWQFVEDWYDRNWPTFAKDNHVCGMSMGRRSFVACDRLLANYRFDSANIAIVHSNAAASLEHLGDWQGALHYRDNAVNALPHNAHRLMQRANTHRALGNFKSEIGDLKQAVALDNTSKEVLKTLAIAYESQKMFGAAADVWRRLVALQPKSASTYVHLGKALLSTGQHDMAADAFSQAIILEPQSALHHYLRGTAKQRLAKMAEADGDYRKALKLNRQHVGAIGWIHEQARERLTEIDSARNAPVTRANEDRRALVISNAQYRHAQLLKNPHNDGAAIAEALARFGFKVTSAKDLGMGELRAAISDFGQRAAGAHWAVLYYSGHGVNLDGRNWIIPTDARMSEASDVELQAIPVTDVLGAFGSVKALQMVILDACRDNPFSSKWQVARASTRSWGRGLTRDRVSDNQQVVFYAAQEGKLALDGAAKHSPFAEAIIETLEQPNLEIMEFVRSVSQSVRRKTNDAQVPSFAGTLTTKLYLNPTKD